MFTHKLDSSGSWAKPMVSYGEEFRVGIQVFMRNIRTSPQIYPVVTYVPSNPLNLAQYPIISSKYVDM